MNEPQQPRPHPPAPVRSDMPKARALFAVACSMVRELNEAGHSFVDIENIGHLMVSVSRAEKLPWRGGERVG